MLGKERKVVLLAPNTGKQPVLTSCPNPQIRIQKRISRNPYYSSWLQIYTTFTHHIRSSAVNHQEDQLSCRTTNTTQSLVLHCVHRRDYTRDLDTYFKRIRWKSGLRCFVSFRNGNQCGYGAMATKSRLLPIVHLDVEEVGELGRFGGSQVVQISRASNERRVGAMRWSVFLSSIYVAQSTRLYGLQSLGTVGRNYSSC